MYKICSFKEDIIMKLNGKILEYNSISSTSKGIIILVISGFICKLLGAFYRLPLTNIVGIEGIGIFQMVMSLYSLSLILCAGGTTIAISKFVSDARAKREFDKINLYLKYGLLLSLSIAIVIGFFFLLFGKSLAIFQGSSENNSYLTFIIVLPLGALIASIRGVFQGYENMKPTAISQIIEQSFKFVFGLSFAIILAKLNIYQGVFGAFLGVVLGEVFASFYLVLNYIRKIKISENQIYDKEKRHEIYLGYLSANFKLTLSESVLPFVHAFDGVIVVSRLVITGITTTYATKLFGLVSGIVGAILNLPLILSFAIQNSLLPNISFLSKSKDKEKEENVVKLGFKCLWFLILPSAFGIATICIPLYNFFYGNQINEFVELLNDLTFLSCISIILTALMQYFNMILHAKGYFSYSLTITSLGGILKILSTFFLCASKEINIFGVVIGNILLASFVCVFAVIKIRKIIDFRIDYFVILIPILSAFIMYIFVSNILSFMNINNILLIVIGIILGAIIYIVLNIPVLISLKKDFEVKNKSGGSYE